MVQKVFGMCEAKNGTEANELQQAGTDGHQRIWQNAEKNSNCGRVLAREAKNWRIEGNKKRITRKVYQRLVNKLEMEGLMAHKGLWNLAKETSGVVVILLGKTLLPRLCCERSTCVCSFFGWSCPGSCRSLCALLSARSTLMLSGSFSQWLQPKSSVVHPSPRLMPWSYSPWTLDRVFPACRQSTGWSRNLNFASPDATDVPTSGHVSRCSGSACVLSEDEFGILVDDRCIDTGAFQPRYLVHELVFACSLPPLPRPRVSHTILTQADWCSTRAVARCELGLLPVIQVFDCYGTNSKSGHGAQKQMCAHDKSQSSQHLSQPTAAVSLKHGTRTQ